MFTEHRNVMDKNVVNVLFCYALKVQLLKTDNEHDELALRKTV